MDREKQYEHVIGCIQAALIHGQSQPWMYEVLAIAMERAGRDQAEIERVVLSLSDFGSADFSSFMFSGAYLVNFDRPSAALKMYQQASRMAPERPEPYVLSLKLASKLDRPEDVAWATRGVLENYWGDDYLQTHRDAQIAAAEAQRKLRRDGRDDVAEAIAKEVSEGEIRDLIVRVEWSGDADLDLAVTEPIGSICSVLSPRSAGGGLYTNDGFGPSQKSAYEEYVCPKGYSGEYRLRIVNQGGNLVSNRATVIIQQAVGTPMAKKETLTVTLQDGDASLRLELGAGRRQQPRSVVEVNQEMLSQLQLVECRTVGQQNPQDVARVMQELSETRFNPLAQQRAGAFSFAPNVRILNDGTSVTAQAIVSPDRRYVRLAINPTFTSITDVFTFSILGGQTNRTGP